jgi:hypothetical protein
MPDTRHSCPRLVRRDDRHRARLTTCLAKAVKAWLQAAGIGEGPLFRDQVFDFAQTGFNQIGI